MREDILLRMDVPMSWPLRSVNSRSVLQRWPFEVKIGRPDGSMIVIDRLQFA